MMPFINPARDRMCERMARLYPNILPCEINDVQLLEMYAKMVIIEERKVESGWIPDEELRVKFPKWFGFPMPADHKVFWALQLEAIKYQLKEFMTHICPTLIADPDEVHNLVKHMKVSDAINLILNTFNSSSDACD